MLHAAVPIERRRGSDQGCTGRAVALPAQATEFARLDQCNGCTDDAV